MPAAPRSPHSSAYIFLSFPTYTASDTFHMQLKTLFTAGFSSLFDVLHVNNLVIITKLQFPSHSRKTCYDAIVGRRRRQLPTSSCPTVLVAKKKDPSSLLFVNYTAHFVPLAETRSEVHSWTHAEDSNHLRRQ